MTAQGRKPIVAVSRLDGWICTAIILSRRNHGNPKRSAMHLLPHRSPSHLREPECGETYCGPDRDKEQQPEPNGIGVWIADEAEIIDNDEKQERPGAAHQQPQS